MLAHSSEGWFRGATVGIARDITECKRTEALQQQLDAERRRLLAAAEQARAEAESANRTKDCSWQCSVTSFATPWVPSRPQSVS